MSDDQVPDLGGLLAQAQQMQQQLMQARASVAEQTVEGQAGGGIVTVRCTGELDFEGVTISPQALPALEQADKGDIEMLEDLVLTAIRDAVARVNALNQEALGGLGGLGGLLS
ncbi:MAG TPA: YbaB/EbfC family nucleoid-associated protein [Acidimicrobiales bacterium]